MIKKIVTSSLIAMAAVLPVSTVGNPLKDGESSLPLAMAVNTVAETIEFEHNKVNYREGIIDPVVEAKVHSYFANKPAMIRVSYCESKWRQFRKDGRLLRGETTPADVGAFQINEYYHGAAAKRMGIDLHTLEGNMKFADYLYRTQGLQPWSASRRCWGR